MKYLLFAILIYVAYQFIFRLLVPVYLATRKLKKGFREMHNRMQEQQSGQQGQSAQSPSPEEAPKHKAGDYIDFEEVK
ncbi:MAG: hypothetical protein ABIT05_12560 [Chitinophagaceae bacterium]